MRFFIVACCLIAVATAGSPSSEYLPPVRGAASAPVASFQPAPLAATPAQTPQATYSVEASAPAPTFQIAPATAPVAPSAPHPVYQVAQSAPVPSVNFAPAAPKYAAPSSFQTYQPAASAPAPQFSSSYTTNYAAPAASAPLAHYEAPAASAPAPAYQAPAQTYEAAASEPAPAHTFSSNDGYRYKTHRRVVYRRHRRDVSHIVPSNDYLPPFAGSSSALPSNEYLPPVAGQATEIESSYAPLASNAVSVAEPAPAHSFSADSGYRYKTNRRRVIRRRRY